MSRKRSPAEGRPIRRSQLALRTSLALLIIGGLGAGAWFTWSIIRSLNEGIESIDLDGQNVGYAPEPTEPTTTTLPPRDLEVLVVTPEGDPGGPGVEIRLRETDEDGAYGATSTVATDAAGIANWLDIAATDVELMVSTTCFAESMECLVPPGTGYQAVALGPGLTSVEVAVERYVLNRTTSGVLSGNEVWASEITLTGSVIIPEGQTLVISAGTLVAVAETDDGSYLDSFGELEKPGGIAVWSEGLVDARGEEGSPIRFDVEEGVGGQWGGLFGTFDAAFVESRSSREIRLSEVSTLADSAIESDLIVVAANAELHHNTIDSARTSVEFGGARLHHNRFRGTSQSGCLQLQGLGGHEIRNNIFIDCPVEALGDDVAQSHENDPPPLVIENNTFVARQRQSNAAVTLENDFYATFRGVRDPSLEEPVAVRFLNNIIDGDWRGGLYLGARPPNSDSVLKHNAMRVPSRGLNDYTDDDSYTYGGRQDRSGLFPLRGIVALGLDFGARTRDLRGAVYFVDPDAGDYRVRMFSPTIDAGHPSIQDADGSPSDIGAYGGPGKADWPDTDALAAIGSCGPEEVLVYGEDFSDRMAQGWGGVEGPDRDWVVVEDGANLMVEVGESTAPFLLAEGTQVVRVVLHMRIDWGSIDVGLNDTFVNSYQFATVDQYSMGDAQWHRYDFVLSGSQIEVLRDGTGVATAGYAQTDIDGPMVVTLSRGESLNASGGARIFLDDIWLCSRQPEQQPEAPAADDSPDGPDS